MATDTLVDRSPEAPFARLGGAPAIEAAVDDFYARVLADASLSSYFSGTDVDRLRAHQRDFFTTALGGPQRYSGRSLDVADRGLGIDDDAFDRVVGHLVDTLRALGADDETIGEVAAALAPLRAQVVNRERRRGVVATAVRRG